MVVSGVCKFRGEHLLNLNAISQTLFWRAQEEKKQERSVTWWNRSNPARVPRFQACSESAPGAALFC